MANTTQLFAVAPGHAQTEQLDVLAVADLTPLPPGFQQLCALEIAGQPHLIGFTADGDGSLFRLSASPPYFNPVATRIKVAGPCDAVRALVLGNLTYLLIYAANTGHLSFYGIDADGAVSAKPYVYALNRPPVLTTNWTTVETFRYRNSCYLVSYNSETGSVGLFKLSVTAVSPAGVPPLSCSNVWSWTWARGWRNFAFFQLGGEEFFFKVNTLVPNVNIDHLSTDPGIRSNEVGTHLDLPDAQSITLARAFTVDTGVPCLLTTTAEGAAAFYRIHADCGGWNPAAKVVVTPAPEQIVPFRVGGRSYVVFYCASVNQ